MTYPFYHDTIVKYVRFLKEHKDNTETCNNMRIDLYQQDCLRAEQKANQNEPANIIITDSVILKIAQTSLREVSRKFGIAHKTLMNRLRFSQYPFYIASIREYASFIQERTNATEGERLQKRIELYKKDITVMENKKS